VLAAGIDPEKGLALAWLPDDAGTWLVVGIFDERAAMEAARSSLGKRTQVSFSPGPSGSTIAQVGKAQLVFVTSGGYLYVHLAGDDATPPKMEAVVGCAPQGLYADPLFASARAKVEGEDALLFVRGGELPNHQALSGDAGILRAHATALVVALTNRESELTLQARMGFDSEGEAVLARALSASPRVELDAKAPAGAVGYLSLSLGAQALSGWIKQGDHQKLDRALAKTGLEDLAPLASGGAALAVYLDLAALFREIAGEAGASKVKVVGALSLTDPQAARGKLEAAASAGKLQAAGPSRWTTTTKGESALTVLEGGAAYFGHQSLLETALEPGPNTRRLSESLRATLPPDALLAGHQTLFVDVAGIIDQLRHPPREATALDGPKQTQLTMLMAAMLEESPQLQPLLPMKDFYLDVSKDGAALTARARLRLR